MAGFIRIAVVYCPVCNDRIEKCNFWPGYAYTNKATGETFVSERGEAPPYYFIYEEAKAAPWADSAVVEPCGHTLTAPQARELGEEFRRQLTEDKSNADRPQTAPAP